MVQDIAVCIGQNGSTSSLYDASAIVVYRKIAGAWKIERQSKISLNKQAGLAGLRLQMAEIGLFLGECKIFVGWAVVGVPYFELEKMQCSIWEFEGEPLSFLDFVLGKEAEKLLANQVEVKLAMPLLIDQGNGDYYISIKELQENPGGITSKQVLLPILRQAAFYSLEILCNHIPPWVEAELKDGNLRSRVEKTAPTETHIYITKRSCRQ
jgi:Fe-only nitrogenase accessory protein AnfO